MARKRMIHTGFFESRNLAALEVAAMVTYAGLWVYGDDRGRWEDDADFVKTKVWPRRREVTADDVERHIDSLVEDGQLCRYEVGGGRFFHTIAWDEHQKISHPTPSKLPPCPTHQPLEWKFWWKDDDTATAQWRDAEKAGQRKKSALDEGRNDSGDSLEGIGINSGSTQPQCSSVQLSSVKAEIPSDSGESGLVKEFVRPSQRRSS